jgi:type I site-specific restriction endonuclease
MKNILLCSMLISSVVCAEEFQAKKYTWQYVVQAKDTRNFETLAEFNGKLRGLIAEMNDNSVRSAGSDIYQKFLVFVKEMQEAIVAGLNLFGSVAISQEPLVALVEEVVEQVAEQAAEEQVAEEVNKSVADEQAEVAAVSEEVAEVSEVEVAPAVNPAIVITFTCKISDASQEEAWNASIATLQTLADKINSNETTSEEVVAALTELYNTLSQLEGSGLNLTAY